MSWKFHPLASKEYLDACRYYAEINANLGQAFVLAVEAAITDIIRNPSAWPALDEDIRRHLLCRFPYGIHYTIEREFILIVSVAHTKRKPAYWHARV